VAASIRASSSPVRSGPIGSAVAEGKGVPPGAEPRWSRHSSAP
jgi:hypothetical protein